VEVLLEALADDHRFDEGCPVRQGETPGDLDRARRWRRVQALQDRLTPTAQCPSARLEVAGDPVGGLGLPDVRVEQLAILGVGLVGVTKAELRRAADLLEGSEALPRGSGPLREGESLG
jgi:hypothetical protein